MPKASQVHAPNSTMMPPAPNNTTVTTASGWLFSLQKRTGSWDELCSEGAQAVSSRLACETGSERSLVRPRLQAESLLQCSERIAKVHLVKAQIEGVLQKTDLSFLQQASGFLVAEENSCMGIQAKKSSTVDFKFITHFSTCLKCLPNAEPRVSACDHSLMTAAHAT